MKIKAPTELRQRIADCQQAMDEQFKDAQSNHEKLLSEITEFEAEASKLQEEIGRLKEEALRSSDAAQKMTAHESRLGLITGRISDLKGLAENFRSPGCRLAVPVLREIIHFYAESLPAVFSRYILPFCGTPGNAARLVALCPANTVIHRISNLCSFIESSPPNDGHRGAIEYIFRRVLDGQPYLGTDAQEEKGESE